MPLFNTNGSQMCKRIANVFMCRKFYFNSPPLNLERTFTLKRKIDSCSAFLLLLYLCLAACLFVCVYLSFRHTNYQESNQSSNRTWRQQANETKNEEATVEIVNLYMHAHTTDTTKHLNTMLNQTIDSTVACAHSHCHRLLCVTSELN